MWQLLSDRLPSRTEVLKRHDPGNGVYPLCDALVTGSHTLISCKMAQTLWSFVHGALGSDWEALDLAGFLQTRAKRTKRMRRLFWLVFVVPT